MKNLWDDDYDDDELENRRRRADKANKDFARVCKETRLLMLKVQTHMEVLTICLQHKLPDIYSKKSEWILINGYGILNDALAKGSSFNIPNEHQKTLAAYYFDN